GPRPPSPRPVTRRSPHTSPHCRRSPRASRDCPHEPVPCPLRPRIAAMTDRSALPRLAGERTDYLAGSLPDDAPADPLELFDIWLAEAFARREEHADLSEPSAVVLSTVAVGSDGAVRPRSRTVLLKGHDEGGFVVFTNLDSDKGRELGACPRAALLLPWYPLQRQVRIEGTTQQVSAAESDAYWAQRPRGSQLGAWASHQSRSIASREALEAQYAEVEERFVGSAVPSGDARVLAGAPAPVPRPDPLHGAGRRRLGAASPAALRSHRPVGLTPARPARRRDARAPPPPQGWRRARAASRSVPRRCRP